MRAARLNSYSKKDFQLSIEQIEKPTPHAQEVLVKVSMAGVNPLDNMITAGEVKLIVPYKLPITAGNEFVGVIESIGADVTNYQVGDRIYARMPLGKIGAFAEYLTIDHKEIALVPNYLSDEEAASVPLTALTAYQALELLKVKPGKTLFISGGTGGFGAMAIPIAKAFGLKVITNGGLDNKNRVLALGADQFIDYKTEDYTKVITDIDYVIDTLGGEELIKQFTILKEGGAIVSLKGGPNHSFAKRMNLSFFKTFLFGMVGRKYDKLASKNNQTYHFIFVKSDGKQLSKISKIFEEKQIKSSVDKVFDFKDINLALDKVKNGRSSGKTIIKF
ncbi:NADP-dependent oxidoreductase [Lactococcus lactis]|uniref:NADP-dependent oxidoreductase n=1 Tax=Lactococcus lactis TaxID=1358 RepID=UPI00289239FC|nr:NADP-dependent oxidoreductase [Lactococcus lactis]MDT2888084.1 NADP-dependent oxidoreductase [Lactococcus lactis]MDT2930889.1 NADP-dependent oxidoreductase [Lactococcus lactis]